MIKRRIPKSIYIHSEPRQKRLKCNNNQYNIEALKRYEALAEKGNMGNADRAYLKWLRSNTK